MNKFPHERKKPPEATPRGRRFGEGGFPSLIGLAWILGLTMALVGIAIACVVAFSSPQKLTYARLTKLPPEKLAKVDIGEMNLLCASGLLGSESLDVDANLATLNDWAGRVRVETERYVYQYRSHPERFRNIEGYYRMQMLVTVIEQDLGISYDGRFADVAAKDFFTDSNRLFIHGLLGRERAGTCASIPVLVTAVARRLGYPVKLVSARAHLFARWENGKNSFNIEATNRGMTSHPDAYYREWPKPITDRMIASEGYLESMTPAQELACFLSTRACCLLVNNRQAEAKAACLKGLRLMPSSNVLRSGLLQ